jgi:hypothetical protein
MESIAAVREIPDPVNPQIAAVLQRAPLPDPASNAATAADALWVAGQLVAEASRTGRLSGRYILDWLSASMDSEQRVELMRRVMDPAVRFSVPILAFFAEGWWIQKHSNPEEAKAPRPAPQASARDSEVIKQGRFAQLEAEIAAAGALAGGPGSSTVKRFRPLMASLAPDRQGAHCAPSAILRTSPLLCSHRWAQTRSRGFAAGSVAAGTPGERPVTVRHVGQPPCSRFAGEVLRDPVLGFESQIAGSRLR